MTEDWNEGTTRHYDMDPNESITGEVLQAESYEGAYARLAQDVQAAIESPFMQGGVMQATDALSDFESRTRDQVVRIVSDYRQVLNNLARRDQGQGLTMVLEHLSEYLHRLEDLDAAARYRG